MKTYLFAAKNSSVTITLSATDEIDAWDVIQVLRPKYDYLKSNRPVEE